MLVYCQAKSKVLLDHKAIFKRICVALEAANAPEIAKKLGITKQAVYRWESAVPGMENLLKVSKSTNSSLHWLLTGQGSRTPDVDANFNFNEALRQTIREIVREEIRIALESPDIKLEKSEFIMVPTIAKINEGSEESLIKEKRKNRK